MILPLNNTTAILDILIFATVKILNFLGQQLLLMLIHFRVADMNGQVHTMKVGNCKWKSSDKIFGD